jgi:hypothetical protein
LGFGLPRHGCGGDGGVLGEGSKAASGLPAVESWLASIMRGLSGCGLFTHRNFDCAPEGANSLQTGHAGLCPIGFRTIGRFRGVIRWCEGFVRFQISESRTRVPGMDEIAYPPFPLFGALTMNANLSHLNYIDITTAFGRVETIDKRLTGRYTESVHTVRSWRIDMRLPYTD